MEYAAKTDIGKKYDHNEDAFALPEPDKKFNVDNPDIKNKGSLFVLCDGIGGLNAGEIVSELTAHWILKEYYSLESNDNLPDTLERVIRLVNTKIIKLANDNESYHGMGTTLIAALFLDNKAFIYSVGDSRVYILKDKGLKQITEDQSEVWPLYKSGALTKDELRFHPRNNIITMAFGMIENIEIQRYDYDYAEGETFLICSDGLSDMVGDEEIKNILMKRRPLKITSNKLIERANKNGGKDNITVIVIKI